MDHRSDADLMMLVRDGDMAAFDELYNRYREPVYRFLFSLTWDEDAAEDCLQETFVRLYRARDRYQPTGRFANYILQIAKNHYLAQARRARRRGEVSLATEDRNGFRMFDGIAASERIEPEAHLIEGYRRWRIRRAIAALPEKLKLVFVMSHFQEMKYAEIAEVLSIPVGTVKSRMFAATRSLQAALKEETP